MLGSRLNAQGIALVGRLLCKVSGILKFTSRTLAVHALPEGV